VHAPTDSPHHARPLVSAVVELRLLGRAQILVAVPFWLIGVLVEPWARALIAAPLIGLVAAVGLYRFTYMRIAREGIQRARRPATHELESALATRGRAVLLIVALTPFILLGAASNQMAVVNALIFGSGAAMRMAGGRLAGWEVETGNLLLREPRRRRKHRGRGNDHGIYDSRDFYVVAA
jgi:hypothetical protein